MLLGTTNPTARSTRLSTKIPSTTSLIQDENKMISGKVADKKVSKPRSVLGDISNISNKIGITKAKADKPSAPAAASRRVNIFSKPVEKAAPVQPAAVAKPPLQPTNKAVSRESSFTSLAMLEKPTKLDEIFTDGDQEMLDGEQDIEIEPMIEDIDANDRDDPQCCTEYVNEIFEYCHQREIMDRVRPDYMSEQLDITERMRAILVDWMVEVHVKFKLLTETMFLSVNIVDRFLAIKPVTRTKLQLVGITAMLLASKYEEIYSPEVRDFIHIADSAYNRDEVLRMERLVLTTMDFNMSASTPLHFLRRFSKASKSDSRTHTLSKYLSELTLTEYSMLKFLPSQIAAASVYIARCMTGRSPWSATLEHYSALRVEDFIDCAKELNQILKKTLMVGYKLEHSEKPPQGLIYAVYKKYSSERLLAVAKLPAVEI